MKKVSIIGLLSILSITFAITCATGVMPAINSIAGAFPTVAYTTIIMVSTIPSLVAIPAALIGGIAIGKMGYKPIALIGLAFFFLGGIAPIFIHSSFGIVLIARAVSGIGQGMLMSMPSALVICLFDEKSRAAKLGLLTLITNLSAMFFQYLGGYLAVTNWVNVFWIHLIAVVAMLLVLLFLPEPEKIVAINQEKPKVKISGIVFLICIIFGLVAMVIMPGMLNVSAIVAKYGFGNAETAGLVMVFFAAGGLLSSLMFGFVYKILKRYTTAFSLLLIAAGNILTFSSTNLTAMIIGMTIFGIAWSLLLPLSMMILSLHCPPESTAISTSLMMGFMNLAMFLGSFWMAFVASVTGDAIAQPLFIGGIILAVGALIFVFVDPSKQKNPSKIQE